MPRSPPPTCRPRPRPSCQTGPETADVTNDLRGDRADRGSAPAATPTTSLGKGSNTLTTTGSPGAPVDLWDVKWPSSGYYWTVMPVEPVALQDGSVIYQDMELPQDACAAGQRPSGSGSRASRR